MLVRFPQSAGQHHCDEQRESLEVRLYCAACLDVWASFEQCQIKKVIRWRGYQDIEGKWKSGGMTIGNRPENQVDLPVR